MLSPEALAIAAALQTREAARENRHRYDALASGDSLYNYYRDYDPAIGRYLQSDPVGLGAGLNTYGYVYGAPLTYIDPQGLSALGDWIGEQWGKWWGGKPGDAGKDVAVDQIGRIQGAKCAKQCNRFKGSSDNYLKASEICFELIPGTQADILSGSAVLNSCATHCVRIVKDSCKPPCPDGGKK